MGRIHLPAPQLPKGRIQLPKPVTMIPIDGKITVKPHLPATSVIRPPRYSATSEKS